MVDHNAATGPDPTARESAARAAATGLSTFFCGLFDALEGLRGATAAVVDELLADRLLAAGPPITVGSATSGRLRAAAAAFLASVPSADGAGIVLAPRLLRPDTAQLQWWRRANGGPGKPRDGLARTEFDLDPASDRYYDYAALDWFAGPYRDGAETVAGPYIDYLGIDYYICTASVPALAHGRVVGVAGCDIRMQDLERAILPLLRELPGAALLGRTRQVLVGNTGRLSTGVLVAAIPPGFRTLPLDVGGAGLELLYRA